MTTATYDTVLEQARQLAPEELRQLRDEISALSEPDTTEATSSARPGLQADLDAIDAFAARVSAAWKSDLDAVEAIREQRGA